MSKAKAPTRVERAAEFDRLILEARDIAASIDREVGGDVDGRLFRQACAAAVRRAFSGTLSHETDDELLRRPLAESVAGIEDGSLAEELYRERRRRGAL